MATIGTAVTSGTPTNTIYYDSLMSTTLAAYRKTMIDNIFKDSAFLSYLRMKGAVKKQNGGQRVIIPLMYGTNSTVKTHGGYSVIDTTPESRVRELEAERDRLKAELESVNKYHCTLGVGDGTSNLFVHGDYDSIKAAQKILFERDKLRARHAALVEAAQRLVDHAKNADQELWASLPDVIELKATLAEVK
jgi:hypothetical protein